jgi:hypothetical protein
VLKEAYTNIRKSHSAMRCHLKIVIDNKERFFTDCGVGEVIKLVRKYGEAELISWGKFALNEFGMERRAILEACGKKLKRRDGDEIASVNEAKDCEKNVETGIYSKKSGDTL